MSGAVEGELTGAGGWRKLARRFTLSTRPDKTGVESTADAIVRWRRELTDAGYHPDALLADATCATGRQDLPRTDWEILAQAVAVLNQTRAVWTRHHAVLAVSRLLPPTLGEAFAEHQARVERLVGRLLADSVQVTPPDVLAVGPMLRRESDGQSVFTAHADVLYAARSTVAAEQRILSALQDRDAPLIPADELAASVARVPLGDDQDAAVYAALTTAARISAIVGPAGSARPTCNAPSPRRGRHGPPTRISPAAGTCSRWRRARSPLLCWPTRPARGRRTSPSGCTSTASTPSEPQRLPHTTGPGGPIPRGRCSPGSW
jgi:hypothetical protein